MFDPLSLAIINNFPRACYQLLENPAHEALERWGLLIDGGEALSDEYRRALCRAAVNNETAILYMEFGPRVQRGPLSVQIITPRADVCHIYSDCAFVHDRGNRLALVRRGRGDERFAIRNRELVRIPDAEQKVTPARLELAARRLACVALNRDLGPAVPDVMYAHGGKWRRQAPKGPARRGTRALG